MQEIRCEKCNKKLCYIGEIKPITVNELLKKYPNIDSNEISEIQIQHILEIKCPRCGKMNTK